MPKPRIYHKKLSTKSLKFFIRKVDLKKIEKIIRIVTWIDVVQAKGFGSYI
jgi:hypothetical protein